MVSLPAGLRMVHAGNPSPMTMDGTRSYVVGGLRPVVIDPGPADERHLGALAEALGGASPVAILLTHAHPDHAAGATALADATGAEVAMARGSVYAGFDVRRVSRWLADGDVLETDAGALRVVALPGHAPEHLGFFWAGERAPEGGALFVGDHMMGGSDTTLVAPPEGDLAAYLRSLERIAALAPGVLSPAHGEPITDPAAAVERYRLHRTGRIEQVRGALRAAGPASPREIARAVYGGEVGPELWGAAEASLLAILAYLQHRGEARASAGRYELTNPAPE